MAGAIQQTDKCLDDLAAAWELLLTSVKPPRKSITSFNLLQLLWKSVTSNRGIKVTPPNTTLAILWCARTGKRMTFLLQKISNPEQPVGIPSSYQKNHTSIVCREHFIIACSHYKPVFGRQSCSLTSKHSTGDPINETLLTHIIQVGRDSLTCLTKCEHHISVGPIFSNTTWHFSHMLSSEASVP